MSEVEDTNVWFTSDGKEWWKVNPRTKINTADYSTLTRTSTFGPNWDSSYDDKSIMPQMVRVDDATETIKRIRVVLPLFSLDEIAMETEAKGIRIRCITDEFKAISDTADPKEVKTRRDERIKEGLKPEIYTKELFIKVNWNKYSKNDIVSYFKYGVLTIYLREDPIVEDNKIIYVKRG